MHGPGDREAVFGLIVVYGMAAGQDCPGFGDFAEPTFNNFMQ